MENVLLDNGKERGATLELALEKALAGWMTPGSGNKNIKGDVRSKLFCAEAKYRSSQDDNGHFIAVDLQWLESIWRTAAKSRRIPLLALEFGNGSRIALLPATSYEDMEDIDWENTQLFNKPGRNPKIHQIECRTVVAAKIIFPNIEVEEKEWAMVDWAELIYLRKTNQEPKTKTKFR